MADHVLTEEVRNQLMGLVPFSKDATIVYTPKLYLALKRDEEGKQTTEFVVPQALRPVFKLRPFNTKESKEIRQLVMQVSALDDTDLAAHNKLGTELTEYLRVAIMGWEKMLDISSKAAKVSEEGSDEPDELEELKFVEYKADPSGGCDKDVFQLVPQAIMADLLNYTSIASGILSPSKTGLKS